MEAGALDLVHGPAVAQQERDHLVGVFIRTAVEQGTVSGSRPKLETQPQSRKRNSTRNKSQLSNKTFRCYNLSNELKFINGGANKIIHLEKALNVAESSLTYAGRPRGCFPIQVDKIRQC